MLTQQEQKHADKFTQMALDNRENYLRAKIQHDAMVLQNTLARVAVNSRFIDAKTFQRDGSSYLQEQLTRVDETAIAYKPAKFTHREIWTVRNVGAGFRTLKQPFVDSSGKAAWMGDAQTDAKNNTGKVNAELDSDQKPVRKCYAWYELDLMDIEAMLIAGEQIDTNKGIALRNAIEATLNETVFFGYKEGRIDGFFTQAKALNFNAVTRTNSTWDVNTAEQIYEDIQKLAEATFNQTKGDVDTKILVVPTKRFKRVQQACFANTNNESVYMRLIANGIISKMVHAPELDTVTSAESHGLVTNQAVAIMTSDDTLANRVEHPLEFTILPILDMQTHIKVMAHANTSGLHVYKKKSSSYMVNI